MEDSKSSFSKIGMQIRECKQCKKTFNFRACPTDISSGRGTFCSRTCNIESRKSPIEIFCKHCKKEIYPRDRLNRIYCSNKCKNENRIGTKRSEEYKKKLSLIKKGVKPKNFGISFGLKGELNNKWKGGVTTENEKIRKSKEYIFWRISVFERDNFTCMDCGVRSRNIQAHHIKCFADYPESRMDIDNGITLCKKCHIKTDTYLNRWN
jgi:5-methylcytosine-specific restriction endonuclease McrA